MAYTALSTVNYNDDWTAADHNKLRDNFIASVPDIFTAKGDIAVGTGATALAAVSGADGQTLVADSGETSGTKWATLNYVPVGGIIMWSGNLSALPSWWKLCDGKNGMADLTDQFLVGAGDTYAVDATGGWVTESWAHTHSMGTTGAGGAHTHTLTVSNESSHTHNNYTSGETTSEVSVGTAEPRTIYSISKAHTHKFNLQAVSHTHTNRNGATSDPGTHTHSAGTTSSAGSASLFIRPPYYALAYIQRIA